MARGALQKLSIEKVLKMSGSGSLDRESMEYPLHHLARMVDGLSIV